MEDSEQTNEDRIALLKKATERHVSGYKEAMTGQAIDNHLFCLYIVSKYLKIESPFLQRVRLSFYLFIFQFYFLKFIFSLDFSYCLYITTHL
ncbi:carnitine O-palmitoyltransferase 1, liver isoform-like [Styela clava]